ncbi:hypothetical protein DENSPDRAFT_822744 [Dentipellis sp. KUC8613]|nr:hypothetical protein DENSPDRAFT_822744 [Dentipellis sp. KUC8613]
MLLKAFLVLSALSHGAFSTSGPNGDKIVTSSSHGVKGAAYLISNEADGNYVISSNIGSDGKLTVARAVYAGGAGAHGADNGPVGTDPFFSQGSVQVSHSNNILATVNAGSNTVSIFKINPQNPSELTLHGKPVNSGGDFPISVAFNKRGDTLCVLNGGQNNGINCYRVDPFFGLVPKSNTKRSIGVPRTNPPSGPPGSLSQIIFSEDDRHVVVSVKGNTTAGFLAVWDVYPGGSLSQEYTKVFPKAGGMLPFSLTVVPGANALLGTDPAIGYETWDLADVQKAQNSSRTTAVAVPGQQAHCWSTYSYKTGNYYLVDAGANSVTELSLDNNLKGTVVKQYPQQANSATLDPAVASINGKDYLYVLLARALSIQVLALQGPGQATSLQTLDFGDALQKAGLHIDAVNLTGMATYVRA